MTRTLEGTMKEMRIIDSEGGLFKIPNMDMWGMICKFLIYRETVWGCPCRGILISSDGFFHYSNINFPIDRTCTRTYN